MLDWFYKNRKYNIFVLFEPPHFLLIRCGLQFVTVSVAIQSLLGHLVRNSQTQALPSLMIFQFSVTDDVKLSWAGAEMCVMYAEVRECVCQQSVVHVYCLNLPSFLPWLHTISTPKFSHIDTNHDQMCPNAWAVSSYSLFRYWTMMLSWYWLKTFLHSHCFQHGDQIQHSSDGARQQQWQRQW